MRQEGEAPVLDGDLNDAIRHYGEGRLPQAGKICRKILAEDPDQPTALSLLGVIAYAAGETDRGVELVSRAIAVKPDYAEAHNNLGNLLRDLGRLAEAEESYLRALDLKPEYAEAHNNLGAALFALGRHEDAAASYRRALAISPDLAEAHNNLGGALQALGLLDEAVASFQKAIAIQPGYQGASANLNRLQTTQVPSSHFPMTDSDYSPDIFEVSNLEEAMNIILTPEDGFASFNRWQKETPPMAEMLAARLNPSSDQTIIDYGCGIGRLAKELIGRTGCNVIGVDISLSMRALSHMYCEADSFFSCSKKALQTMMEGGLRADHAYTVWVLQHTENPEEDIDLIHDALADGGTFFVLNLDYRSLPTSNGWRNDGIDIKHLIERRFDIVEYFPPPDGAVTDLARRVSFCGLYRKTPVSAPAC